MATSSRNPIAVKPPKGAKTAPSAPRDMSEARALAQLTGRATGTTKPPTGKALRKSR